jgi:hypothetical protein
VRASFDAKPSTGALNYHAPFELCEHAHHLKQRFAGRSAGVEALAMQV